MKELDLNSKNVRKQRSVRNQERRNLRIEKQESVRNQEKYII